MEKQNQPFGPVRFVFHRASPLMKCVVLTLLVAGIAALVALRVNILDSRQKQADLKEQAVQLAQENRELTQNIAKLGTVESVKRIAETELGLVDPNTQFFTPGN